MVIVSQVGEPLVGLTAKETVITLKAAAQWPAVEGTCRSALFCRRKVPLADAESVITVFQQYFWEHPVLEGHAPIIARITGGCFHDRRHTTGMVVAPGQDAGPRGGTQGGGVHVRVAQTVLRQAVNIGRVDQSTKSRHLPIADIVQDEENHVGRIFFGSQGFWPGGFRFSNRAPDHTGKC